MKALILYKNNIQLYMDMFEQVGGYALILYKNNIQRYIEFYTVACHILALILYKNNIQQIGRGKN